MRYIYFLYIVQNYAVPSMTHWSKCKMYLRRIISAHVVAGRHYRDYIDGLSRFNHAVHRDGDG